MRHVSDIAKNPESASSPASAAKSQPRSMLSVKCETPSAPEDQLEHDLAADEGEQQRRESGERPVHGDAPAPAAHVAAHEEPAEYEPRGDPEHRLVREREGLAEELLGEEDAAHEREGEEHEGGEQHAEEQ